MSVSQQIDKYIQEQDAWKAEKLTTLRRLIHEVDPEIEEEWKWDVPIFRHEKMICAISAFTGHVKINFFHGAKLEDPDKLFNNGFTSKQHRSIDFKEGDTIQEEGIKNLIKRAISLSASRN